MVMTYSMICDNCNTTTIVENLNNRPKGWNTDVEIQLRWHNAGELEHKVPIIKFNHLCQKCSIVIESDVYTNRIIKEVRGTLNLLNFK